MRHRATLLFVLGAATSCRAAPFYEQSYLGARHNWEFRKFHPLADRTLNAFDYGHAILYETLLTRPATAERALEEDHFRFITGRLLDNPPVVPLDEGAVGPSYVRLVPELRAMFAWAHVLHRQLYDVWADGRIPPPAKDARVAGIVRYYRSRPDLALSSVPKSMDLMEGQRYSRSLRTRAPRFNGLIWSYHWMQMALYDGLLAARDGRERAANVGDVVRRFRAMHGEAPSRLPTLMPMTSAVAPRFAARYPEASIIFDNMHALHDVVADILASPVVPEREKRSAILRAAANYRDDTTAVTTIAAWRDMAAMMGAERMGGVAMPAVP